MSLLNEPLALACGAVIPNRFCKSAMTEGLSSVLGKPGRPIQHLYRAWSEGGAGLLVTGNVMIDKRYLERVGNAVLEDEEYLDDFKQYAAAATIAGNHCWMQISHPGRQCTRAVAWKPIAPSAEQLDLLWFFSQPREMNEDDIQEVMGRYVKTAMLAKEAGFTGVQVHAAHGYLLSQFLSPITNKRTDSWGGSLENRAKLLLSVVKKIREKVGDDFPIGVKLNSKDFQTGGFSLDECAQVAQWLKEASVDLLEISGGNYASMAFLEGDTPEDDVDHQTSTQKREAFFLKYAEKISAVADIPLMITGGFRTKETMEYALGSGHTQMIGVARPLCVHPDLPKQFLMGEMSKAPSYEHSLELGKGIFSKQTKNKTFKGLIHQSEVAWFYQQIIHLSEQQSVDVDLTSKKALIRHLSRDTMANIKRKFAKA